MGGAWLSNNHLLLRWLRLHDDATLRGRHSDILQHSALCAAHQDYVCCEELQNDQINKQTDQMYVLLALCITLHPQRIDESLHTTLREKNYAEKMNKMSRGELPEFEASFTFSCPKFLSPVPPNYDDVNFDAYSVSSAACVSSHMSSCPTEHP